MSQYKVLEIYKEQGSALVEWEGNRYRVPYHEGPAVYGCDWRLDPECPTCGAKLLSGEEDTP